MRIYHIVKTDVWRSFAGEFYSAESLGTEGFTHCSFADQLDGVIARYYADAGEVVVLEIDAAKLTSRLVSEPSTGGEKYPHIYGPINKDAIVSAETRKV
jgi:uncharacterized protein (DUF952 family)